MISAPYRTVQQIGQTTQFCLKLPVRAAHFADKPAEQHLTLADIRPVDQIGQHLGTVIATGFDVFLANGRRRQGPQRFGVINGQARALLQRHRGQSGLGLKIHTVKGQITVMIGKAQNLSIIARDFPAARHGRMACAQMRLKLCNAHTRISTTGTLGASPA